ncbi:MAG TPA: hypothetical protein VFE42_14220 [Chloroflexota bacterium]|nr:hypothetical protein [Chloroflexota bacterium]
MNQDLFAAHGKKARGVSHARRVKGAGLRRRGSGNFCEHSSHGLHKAKQISHGERRVAIARKRQAFPSTASEMG